MDESICNVTLTHKYYGEFVSLVWKTTQNHIPRGCWILNEPGLSEQTSQQYKQYSELFVLDPFGEETIGFGKMLMRKIGKEQCDS